MLYHFHDFELDERLYQLRRGGKPVEIEPKVFDVLVYLLHHRNHVVSKDHETKPERSRMMHAANSSHPQ
jgi:DNA-binding winged helix-turn-helix (wHTH) protein